jgi:hypothetical protein
LLLILIVSACGFSTNNPNEINYRKLVDKKAEFIGKGIKVPPADKKWDWLLPDLNSTAQKSSQAYQKPAGENGAKYLRSFKLYDDIGFVWSWQHQGLEIFLIYTFLGTNGYYIRTVHNTHNISVDEAILATYFDTEFSSYLQSFEVEKWQIDGIDDDFDIESLGFLGQQLFSQTPDFNLFEGRILTLPWTFVKYENQQFYLCDRYYQDKPCWLLPASFIDFIQSKNLTNEIKDNPSFTYLLKVKFGDNNQISDVLAGNIVRENDDYTSDIIIEWPIPKGYLGAGAIPFYIDTE